MERSGPQLLDSSAACEATGFKVSPFAFADWQPSEDAYTITAVVQSCEDIEAVDCRSETVEMSLSRRVRWRLSNVWKFLRASRFQDSPRSGEHRSRLRRRQGSR